MFFTVSPCGQVDIIIILDSSQSIDETLFNTVGGARVLRYLQDLKDFVKRLSNYYSFIGDLDQRAADYYTQIAVVRFSAQAETLLDFTDAKTRVEFQALVDSRLFYQKNGNGNTNTAE